MKLSTLFCGVLFVLIGGLFILNNLGYVCLDWGTVWRLWPLILIFWGLSIIIGKQSPPWYAVLLMILLLAFMVVALVATEWIPGDFDVATGDATMQTFEEPMAPKTERATFRLQSGAGRFLLQDTTSMLVKAETEVSFGKYNLRHYQSDNETDVTLEYRGPSRGWNFGKMRNRADIQLNADPVWSIYVEIGAASVDFDLSPYKVEELRIDAGASSTKVKLGDRSEETTVRVKTGASSTRIDVPESAGCEVRLQTALSGKRIRGFEKVRSNRYQTPNFETAKKKISVVVEAGVSQITVERY